MYGYDGKMYGYDGKTYGHDGCMVMMVNVWL